MVPFTVEQFFAVFEAYNRAIWPAQVLAYILGGAAVWLALSPRPHSGRLVAAVLAGFWLWMGIAYHLWHFAAINPAAYLFGVAFVVQGVLFIVSGVLREHLSFRFRPNVFGLTGLTFIAYAAVLYAVLGHLGGHGYPKAPVFGVAPCPTTILTFGVLLLTDRPVPSHLLVIPVLWSLIGGSAAVLLAVPEDTGLIAAGVGGGLLLALRGRHPRHEEEITS
jgi:Family of unknown function (DUF6064)